MKTLVGAAFAVPLALSLFAAPAKSAENVGSSQDKIDGSERKKEQDLITKEILKKIGARHRVRPPHLDKFPSAHEAVRSGCLEAVSVTLKGEASLQAFDQEIICKKKEAALMRLEKMHANAGMLTGVPVDPAEITWGKADLDLAYRRLSNLAAIVAAGGRDRPAGPRPPYMTGVEEGRDFTVRHCPPPD